MSETEGVKVVLVGAKRLFLGRTLYKSHTNGGKQRVYTVTPKLANTLLDETDERGNLMFAMARQVSKGLKAPRPVVEVSDDVVEETVVEDEPEPPKDVDWNAVGVSAEGLEAEEDIDSGEEDGVLAVEEEEEPEASSGKKKIRLGKKSD